MADDSPGKRTAGSQRALGLAELVNKVFANERVPSTLAAHAGYRVEIDGVPVFDTMQEAVRDAKAALLAALLATAR